LVFVWHGHGGSSRGAARQFRIHQHWPTAIVVYPQGLPTPSMLIDPEGLRSGWQSAGDAKTNRDIRFFDAMLEDWVGRGIVDPELVFSTGHSNGGGFTYNLLVERGKRLAAIAPSSSASARHRNRAFPKIPVFHVAGRNDRLVKMEWQQATIDRLLRFYDCGSPKQWGGCPDCLEYASKEGHTLVTYVHEGTHKMPEDAGALITSFFQRQAELVRMRLSNHDPSNVDPKQDLERPSQHSMVYELRTYTAAEGKLDALESRFRDHTMDLFERHGMKNIAYWIPVDVPNTLIYVLAHHDRDTAKKSWRSFVNDQDWQRVFKASRADGPLVVRIESVFMKATDYSPKP
ncbi:MAG: NIPSNAP family protein, partial [Planctomycetota bacterium]|nr:NIPSNAP family protein [Planctomycetota bacterium]